MARLYQLLQESLWTLWWCRLHAAQLGRHRALDELLRGVHASIEVRGTDERLVERGRQTMTRPAARFFLAASEPGRPGQSEPQADRREGVPADERCAQGRELSLVELRELTEKPLGHDEVDDRVAEVLEALEVIALGLGVLVQVRAVRERGFE
jgi:hypothetical protein